MHNYACVYMCVRACVCVRVVVYILSINYLIFIHIHVHTYSLIYLANMFFIYYRVIIREIYIYNKYVHMFTDVWIHIFIMFMFAYLCVYYANLYLHECNSKLRFQRAVLTKEVV